MPLRSAWEAELTASPGPKESPGDQKRVSFLPRGFVAAPRERLGYNGIIIVKIRIAMQGRGGTLGQKAPFGGILVSWLSTKCGLSCPAVMEKEETGRAPRLSLQVDGKSWRPAGRLWKPARACAGGPPHRAP